MTQVDWFNILLALTGIPSLVLIILISVRDKSLSRAYFGLAILSFLAGIGLGYIKAIPTELSIEWGNLLAITFTLCGLFVIIRNSKPVFARFPLYMTTLPLLVVFFYPIINDAEVVKELLMIIYEGGALIVSFLVFGINQFVFKNRALLLLGVLIFLSSYISFWFIKESMIQFHEEISISLFSFGILVLSIGFKRISEKESKQ